MQTEINAVDNLLTYLFADKKAVYIDDIIDCGDSYEVAWCFDHALKSNHPQWYDTTITRARLLQFIVAERLNYWEAFRYDDATGNIQPFTNCTHDMETFLNENYRDVVKEWLQQQSESPKSR